MPLERSKSPAAFKRNVAAEINSGRPRDQSLAIAYRIKREGRAMGGRAPHTGPINSVVPGRTDRHNMAVPAGSYVIPSETISHLGENNTAAGMKVLTQMFGSSGPYGVGKNPAIKKGSGAPKAPKAKTFANGGAPAGDDSVDVVTAGGEFVVPPEVVTEIGGGDIDRGHEILDAWVLARREDHIKTLKGLDGPAKD